ncbi:putative receptor protein kinase ZmPK1 [Rutidosis leptorrhynchoides]|uniref:putative receptor protein kinase ZmPK1 n=1 Tax=Rutidosis leptorrhynchoides TaxID=125765 RepID=UPI003A991391
MHLFLLLLLVISYSQPSSSSSSPNVLTQGSSLVVQNDNHLVSPNRVFTAGFHQTGQNAYFFAIWFSDTTADGQHTLVWMANRDAPVNGKRSSFSLSKTGNLVLTDAGQKIWTSNTKSTSPSQLQLLDSGNLVLTQIDTQSYLWQSFSFPTNTLLPNQPFTKDTVLISSRSLTNYSSGFYKLYFDNDNVLRILFKNDAVTSVFWPKPWLLATQAGRSTFNNSRFAMLDSRGRFTSTDNYSFVTSDYGPILKRRITLDVDGNVRVYTLNEKKWTNSLQTISKPCLIHGSCGLNSICTYTHESGRRCTCIYGYVAKNHSDLSLGCVPTFNLTEDRENYGFVKYPQMEFYGFDYWFKAGISLQECENVCLNNTNCKAFQYSFNAVLGFKCYVKTMLFNGHNLDTPFTTYLKVPKKSVSSFHQKAYAKKSELICSNSVIKLMRTYVETSGNRSIKFMLWFSLFIGVVEVACFLFLYYITRQRSGVTIDQSYVAIATGFRRFTYDEIIKASNKFRDEIGRGGGSIVYKGTLPDNRVVAIKRLHQATTQGEAEFLAEMSTIMRINHKNLIETYGYCAEGKHRILVYEYMENGSLAAKLGANQLDWPKILAIATGVAKGLAYLHEECLEWVLHCDVKPHNILLDVDYNPKVADFGLSKLIHQDAIKNSVFSRIRGTRGYMAPEWVFKLPITSKVDVYSYGMVVLEMITGRSPTRGQASDCNEAVEQKGLVNWVREKVYEKGDSLIEQHFKDILDPKMMDEYEHGEMVKLLKVALRCVEENKDLRPTMSEVVKILCNPKTDDYFD